MNKENKSGILLVDKKAGVTSHDLVAMARKGLGMKKVGHAGTLDPFATGLLVLLVGEGTKVSSHLMDGDKVYRGRIVLGKKTNTGDSDGEVMERLPFDHISEADFRGALSKFEGTIVQIPPMFSAVKVKGVPLYKHARKGLHIERQEREVTVHEIRILSFSLPYVEIEVRCSKGTYMRTLAEDIAGTLGSCGHLDQLRRTGSGSFSVEYALPQDDLANGDCISDALIPLKDALTTMPEIVVSAEAVRGLANGIQLKAGWIEDVKSEKFFKGDACKVTGPDGGLISIVEVIGEFPPTRGFNDDALVGKSLRVFNL